MYAISLLGSTRRVERRGMQLLEMRTYPPTDTESKLLDAVVTLVDIAELLRAGSPFPPVQHTQKIQTFLTELLQTRYEQPSVGPDECSEEVFETVRQEVGIEVGKSCFFIPLEGTETHTKNWHSVFSFLRSRVQKIIEDFRRIGRRLESGDSERRLVETCDNVVEMLEVFEYTLDRIMTTNRYVSYRTDQNQRELLDAIEQKATAIRGDTDA